MKKRIIRIVRMKIFLVLILASPLLVFNTIYAADVSAAILKAEVTLASTTGSPQTDKEMTFPMSTTALTSLGLLNSNFKNQQLCVEGSVCPEADEVLSSPAGWMYTIDDPMTVRHSTYYNGDYQYYNQCQNRNTSGYNGLAACGGVSAVQLFNSSGVSNTAVGDEFFLSQEQPYNAMKITIDTPWSQGGGGTLACQWYYVPSGGASAGSYVALQNVEDPSECFSVAGTHTISWDALDGPSSFSAGYASWASSNSNGYWFGFVLTSVGAGATIWPTGKDVEVERQEWATIAPEVSASGTAYDLYVGGPDIQSESYLIPTQDGSTYALEMDSLSSLYGSPFITQWTYKGGYAVEFEAYFDVTTLGGYPVDVFTISGLLRCVSNFAHFGCTDYAGNTWGGGTNYNCPGGYQYSNPAYQMAGTMTEGWHKIRWERPHQSYPGYQQDSCRLYVDDVLIQTGMPYTYYDYVGASMNMTHRLGGNENIKGVKTMKFDSCYYNDAASAPSGNNWCGNAAVRPYNTQYYYAYDFTDGWENPMYEVDELGTVYNGIPYYVQIRNLGMQSNSYHSNAYTGSSANTSATVGSFIPLAAGGGGATASTELPPADVITDFNPTGTFAGDTTIGTGLPGGDFLGSIATRDNLPISFVWSLIAAGLVICTIAAGMKYLKSILVASLAGGVVLAAFTVPGVGIFPIWVLFFYAIVATTTVVVTNKTGVF